MTYRPRNRGTTTDRGYGAEHQQTRKALLPYAYGRACAMCGQTMWPGQRLALDHTPDRTAYRGIVHASCNARDGAMRGNRQRGRGGVGLDTSRVW